MAISYPLTIPTTIKPKSAQWRIVTPALVTRSLFTGQQSGQVRQGARWECVVTYPSTRLRGAVEDLLSYFIALDGPIGTLYWYEHNYRTPRGTPTGTPLVDGASQTGEDIVTDGWGVSSSGVLLPGDWIQVGTELKRVMNSVSSNGSGQATITVRPRQRVAPSDNAAIVSTNPVGIFRLIDNTFDWDIDTAASQGFSVALQEAV